jgi:tetratricopeptide (TPR) repeat protein
MSARGHCELGLVLVFTGMFDESLEELNQAVNLDPLSCEFRNHLGLTYCMLGMYDEGRVEFEKVLEQDPANAVALRQMEFFQ